MASNQTSYNNLTPAAALDKATLNKMVWRSLNLQGSFNYERMQAAGWLYGILPGLEKIHVPQPGVLQHSPLPGHLRYGHHPVPGTAEG